MDAFHRAFRSHAHFDPAGNFPGWIRRIATNLALDHLRSAKRNVPLAQEDATASGDPYATAGANSRSAPSEQALATASQANPGVMRRAPEHAATDPAMRREAREQIAAAFADLPPKLRVVATLALIEDVPYAEIADALGITEGAARVRAHRAVEVLREKLQHLRTA